MRYEMTETCLICKHTLEQHEDIGWVCECQHCPWKKPYLWDDSTLTEVRMVATAKINADAAATPEQELKQRLEANYPGDVYNTQELQEKFEVLGFAAPFVVVVRKSDNKEGSLEFTHKPRFYYNFQS